MAKRRHVITSAIDAGPGRFTIVRCALINGDHESSRVSYEPTPVTTRDLETANTG
jgi:hypothetical protein